MIEKNLLDMIRDYYDLYNDKHIHIISEDGNVEDEHVMFCLDECNKHNNVLGSELCIKILNTHIEVREFIFNELYNEYRFGNKKTKNDGR